MNKMNNLKEYCNNVHNHEPNTICKFCHLEVDEYGNTEADFVNCSFPDCGCDGARLCIVRNPNTDALQCNVEGMYKNIDKRSLRARRDLVALVHKDKK